MIWRLRFMVWFVVAHLLVSASQASGGAPNGRLEKITFVSEGARLEKVIFKLNGPSLPRVFAIKGERQRVVFDFYGVRPAIGVPSRIKAQGNMIKEIRMGIHLKPRIKTRVVFDLSQVGDIDFRQDFDLSRNTLTISVFRDVVDRPSGQSKAPSMSGGEEGEKMDHVMEEGLRPLPPHPPSGDTDRKKERDATSPRGGPPDKNFPVLPDSRSVLLGVAFTQDMERGDIVLFRFHGLVRPRISSVADGLSPKILCEFQKTRLGGGVVEGAETGGRYVTRIETKATDEGGVQVMLELLPGNSYDLQQILFKQEEEFVLIVNKR